MTDTDVTYSQSFAITRRIEIDAAHRIPNHKSKCFNIHGHRYVIEATCIGDIIAEGEQEGMVMDFGFLKQVMMEQIHDRCDHAMMLYCKDPLLAELLPQGLAELHNAKDLPGSYDSMTGLKVQLLNDVPTAENLAKWWYDLLGVAIDNFFHARKEHDNLPWLKQVKVWETPNCFAVYPGDSV